MFSPKTKFLVVDDYSTMRRVVAKILAEMGYTNIVEAENGQQAIEVLQSQLRAADPVQFVVSDWNMPVMMGIDLLKYCKSTVEFKSLPFILVTAEGEQQQILEAARAGVNDYLMKPFTAAKFKEKIERVYVKLTTVKKVG